MKALRWAALNGAIAGLAAYGVLADVAWARNLSVFAIWLALAMSVFLFLALTLVLVRMEAGDDVPMEGMIEDLPKGHSVPTWVSVSFDVCFVVFLVAFGWFATAAAWIVCDVLTRAVLRIAKDIRRVHETRLQEALR
jgi:hypothetical protein